MRNSNELNENQQGFLNTLKKLTNEENRLKSTTTYKILDELSDAYVELGIAKATIKSLEITSENKLATEKYKDLVDIYFYIHKLLIKTPKDKAFIDAIEFISSNFNDQALDYIETYAFSDYEEQVYALKFLLFQALIEEKKQLILEKIRFNFNNFDEKTKDFVKEYSALLFRNERLEFGRNQINLPENDFVEEVQIKKWWEFWK
nr:hypothetical protein [uncultured Flavobacterium sp.]